MQPDDVALRTVGSGEIGNKLPGGTIFSPMSSTDSQRATRFHELVVPHLDDAYSLARYLSRDPFAAEDVVQDACLRAFRHLDSLRNHESRPWLLKIVRNCFYASWSRNASRRAEHPTEPCDEDDDDSAEDASAQVDDGDPQCIVERAHDRQTVHELIGELPMAFREVLVLRELQELSYRNIAEILGIPIGTVMSRLARARAHVHVSATLRGLKMP